MELKIGHLYKIKNSFKYQDGILKNYSIQGEIIFIFQKNSLSDMLKEYVEYKYLIIPKNIVCNTLFHAKSVHYWFEELNEYL